MKSNFCSAIIGLTVCSLAASALASDKPLATVSVAPTKPKGTIAYWQPAMGEGLAQMMVTKLSGLSNMRVLESLKLDDLREERRLGETGEIADTESVKKGAWKGADYT